MILDHLNRQQRQAVEHYDSPLLVIAGAGSGKTRVITHKIAWLIKKKGIKPSRILAITFTKKAANEMQERVEALLGMRPKWISTFHSFCVKVLRQECEELEKGFDKKFLIYDEDDSMKVIKDILRRMNREMREAEISRGLISKAKQEYRENIVAYLSSLPFPLSNYAAIADQYQRILEQSNAMDYDDLIYYVADMFIKKPSIRKRWQDCFDYVLVDEYQDTNKIQYLLVNLLIGRKGSICVVGDPQQCIYTWRGAHPLNILNFEKDHKPYEAKLEVNYRSAKKILRVANRIIAKADRMWDGKILELSTFCNEEGVVEYVRSVDNTSECLFIAQTVRRLINEGYKCADMAVLMRMSFLSRGIEHIFVREGIPYQIVSGAAFFDRAEVKDALAYLRFMLNKRDKAAFERIVNIPPRSIGQKTLKRIQLNYAVDWIQALKDTRLAARQKKQTEMLIQLIEQYAGHVDEQPYTVIMQVLKEINYSSYLMTHYDDYEDREGNISELTNVLKGIESEGKSLSSFLEDSVLAHEQDKIQKTESVKVMTVHAAKGLEFPVVFVMGLEEGIFPSGRSMSNRLAVEEERRLFYVAATRAKERLYLSSAAYRMKFGSNAFMSQSRYIEEIQEEIEVSKQRVY